MEQRKINELRKRNAKVVIKAGIPFKVFDDEDLDNDQMSEMMSWCDEADEEGLLPIEVEEMTPEQKLYADTFEEARQYYAETHSDLLKTIRNETDCKRGMRMFAEYYDQANNYAKEVCKQKGLK